MSETALARPVLAKYCQEPFGVDLGFGGDAIVPHAITFDMESPYTNVGEARQILKGSVKDLSCFASNGLDWVYSSHLLEDWTYKQLIPIVTGIRRILKPGGLFISNCPDEKIYAAHCKATGQGYNLAHQNFDFSLETFKEEVLPYCGPWEIVYENPLTDIYSWHLVVRKTEKPQPFEQG